MKYLHVRFLDRRYNDFFTIVAVGRTKTELYSLKMVYENKPHLNQWIQRSHFDYMVNGGQYIAPKQ